MLLSRTSKKQNPLAISTTEVKYIMVGGYCAKIYG